MARFGTPAQPEPKKVEPTKDERAQAKLEELWDGIEEAARVEREAVAQWEREGKKGPVPTTPAVERLMQVNKRGAPRWGRE